MGVTPDTGENTSLKIVGGAKDLFHALCWYVVFVQITSRVFSPFWNHECPVSGVSYTPSYLTVKCLGLLVSEKKVGLISELIDKGQHACETKTY